MDNKITHMQMIQEIINRMASNSFALKGWSVTLVAGIFALSSKEADKMYFLIAYVPVIVFWLLDAYYLLQERLYRSLYNKIRKLELDEIDFDMNTAIPELKTDKNNFWNCFLSKTELGFYLPLAFLTASIIIITMV